MQTILQTHAEIHILKQCKSLIKGEKKNVT